MRILIAGTTGVIGRPLLRLRFATGLPSTGRDWAACRLPSCEEASGIVTTRQATATVV
jgi:hypothetical protein